MLVARAPGRRTLLAWADLAAVTRPEHSALVDARELERPLRVEVGDAGAGLRVIERSRAAAVAGPSQ